MRNTYLTFDGSNALPAPASPTSWARLPSLSRIASNIYQRLPGRYSLLNAFFSATTAIPYLPYTVQLFTGTHPKDFSLAWWAALPLAEKALAGFMTIFTYAISVIVHYKYFPDTEKRLLEIFSNWQGRFFVNTATVFLTVATMVSAYGLGYDGLVQAGILWAVLGGVFNAGLYGAFRLAFVPSFFNRIKNFFDADEYFKNKCIAHVNQFASPSLLSLCIGDETLNKKNIFNLLLQIDKELQDSSHSSPYRKIINASGLGFDVLIGLSLFVSYFLYNIQTGYRGLEVIVKLINDNLSLDYLSHFTKIAIGLASGLSSGMVGYVMGYDMRQLLLSIYDYIKEHSHKLLLNLVILSGIVLSSILDMGPIVSPAYNMASDADNLIFVSMDNMSGPLFVGCAALFSILIDLSAMVAFTFKKEYATPEAKQKQEVIDWIKQDIKSPNLMHKLNRFGIFSKNKEERQSLPDTMTYAGNTLSV